MTRITGKCDGSNNVAWAARRLPFVPIPDGPPYRIRPIHVENYADLVVEVAPPATTTRSTQWVAISQPEFTVPSTDFDRNRAVNPPNRPRLPHPLPEPADRLLHGVVVNAEVNADRLHGAARSAHLCRLSGDPLVHRGLGRIPQLDRQPHSRQGSQPLRARPPRAVQAVSARPGCILADSLCRSAVTSFPPLNASGQWAGPRTASPSFRPPAVEFENLAPERPRAYRRGHVGLAARGLIGYADFYLRYGMDRRR